mgnify:CR=1 FL=1
MTDYYDIILALIPLALGGITVSLTTMGTDPTTALQMGSLVALGIIGHALFVRSPQDISMG